MSLEEIAEEIQANFSTRHLRFLMDAIDGLVDNYRADLAGDKRERDPEELAQIKFDFQEILSGAETIRRAAENLEKGCSF